MKAQEKVNSVVVTVQTKYDSMLSLIKGFDMLKAHDGYAKMVITPNCCDMNTDRCIECGEPNCNKESFEVELSPKIVTEVMKLLVREFNDQTYKTSVELKDMLLKYFNITELEV